VNLLSAAFGAFDEDVLEGFPEVAEVGAQGGLLILLEVAHFRGLDLIGRFREVIVERGDQSGLVSDALLLQFRGVKTEIVSAEGAYAGQFHIAADPVPEAGQFVEPVAAEEPAPGGHPEVIFVLSAVAQVIPVVDVILNELTVGVIGVELVDLDQFPLLADAPEVDQRTVGGVADIEGRTLFTCGHAEMTVVGHLLVDDETDGAEAPQDFGAAHHVTLSLGEVGVNLPEGRKFGDHPHQDKIAEIVNPVEDRGNFRRIRFPRCCEVSAHTSRMPSCVRRLLVASR